MMRNRDMAIVTAVVVVVLLLIRSKGNEAVSYAPPTKVEGVPEVTYIVDSPLPPSGAPVVVSDNFDWLGTGDCHCNTLGRGSDINVIQSVHLVPPPNRAYSFVQPPDLTLPPALKGASYKGIMDSYIWPTPDLPQQLLDLPPPPIVYQAPRKEFWWGWQGLSRVIYTSDGHTLATGLGNRPWTVVQGTGPLDQITVIHYLNNNYYLRA